MQVSVIIPVGHDVAGLATTLRSIQEQNWDPAKVEVIVCNDGGGTRISEVIARFECIEVRLEENRGSYAARNAGVHASRGTILAFLDADETVTEDWLTFGVAALDAADYAGGRIVVASDPAAPFWERVDATFAFPVADYLKKRKYAPTANLFVKREVFEDLGGFDEALRSGGDREFGVRVSTNNRTQCYCERAVVVHPARNFREQLQKLGRTSRGNATLEVMLWRRNAIALGVRSIIFSMAKACQVVALAMLHAFSRTKTRPGDARLLAAGRALIDACYYSSLAAHSLAMVFRRDDLRSSVPKLARLQ